VDTVDKKPGDQPETVETLLNSIHPYFAMFANCEQVSLSETEEANVLSLTDITYIGSTGLDLVEKVQDKLKAENPAPTPIVVAEDVDPLAGLMELPLDRIVTVYLTAGQSLRGALAESPDNQIILFGPRSRASSHYHTVPLTSISAWSDMRGEESDELYLYNRQYLTQRQIQDKEKSRANG
jgi:ABC-type transporter Mla MlaB component